MTTYTYMERTLQAINANYVTMNTDEIEYNNKLLKLTLENVISIMKDKDRLFKDLYERLFFAGSFYDDLKVGKPDEFDIDLVLKIPPLCGMSGMNNCRCVNVAPSNKPGFFWFAIKENHYPPINKLIKDGYMQTDLVINWLKGLITITLNDFIRSNNSTVYGFSFDIPPYIESGPAITLKLRGKFGNVEVDLVPSFKCDSKHWPQYPYRPNPSRNKTEFFIVPKKAKEVSYSERYWRASFQEQERELIEGKERLKPALRLLKKMRNNLVHLSVFSYALKTIALWEVERGSFYANESLSDTFMSLLEKYQRALENQKIPYFWNAQLNLLANIDHRTLTNHYNEITNKITEIKLNRNDPLVVAKLILNDKSEEYRLFIKKFHN